MAVVATTPPSAVVVTSPSSSTGVITRSASATRRREVEVEPRTFVSNVACYIEFLREEEEHLVEL